MQGAVGRHDRSIDGGGGTASQGTSLHTLVVVSHEPLLGETHPMQSATQPSLVHWARIMSNIVGSETKVWQSQSGDVGLSVWHRCPAAVEQALAFGTSAT